MYLFDGKATLLWIMAVYSPKNTKNEQNDMFSKTAPTVLINLLVYGVLVMDV